MKTSLFVELYRKVGEGLGLLDPHAREGPPKDMKKIRAALDVLEKIQ